MMSHAAHVMQDEYQRERVAHSQTTAALAQALLRVGELEAEARAAAHVRDELAARQREAQRMMDDAGIGVGTLTLRVGLALSALLTAREAATALEVCRDRMCPACAHAGVHR